MKRFMGLIFLSTMLLQAAQAPAQPIMEKLSYAAFEADSFRNQHHEPDAGEPLKQWSVMFQLGDAGGGPFRQIERAMSRNGFGATSPGGCFFIFCSPSKSHPYSTRGGLIWGVTLMRHIRKSYSASLNFSSYLYAETHGYHSSAGSLTIRYSAATVGALLHTGAYDLFTIGLGPLVSFTTTDNGDRSFKRTTPGFIFDIALKVPRRSTVYGALNIQYKWIPGVEVGPFTARSFSGSAVFPPTKVNYSYRSLGLALGFRF